MIFYRILKQVSYFNYSENDIGYDRNYDIDVISGKFQKICGTTNRTFTDKVRRDSKLRFYKVIAALYCPTGENYGHQPRNKTVKYLSLIHI